MTPKVRLLETTLRDGSYEIDFQFTAEDTGFIASALDRAGVGYIEIGHGNGIGTTRWNPVPKSTRAAATDEEHLEAARAAVEHAKLGVLMVAGERFAPLEVLELLPRYGFHFVRLGLEPRDAMTPLSMKYIARAKELGLLVSVNQMQTYALSEAEIAKAAAEAAKHGADWYYLVDSAGGMIPDEVKRYVKAVREATDLEIGLHAHNNSGLAVANSLAALDAGANLVDSTLQGIGRATGNPPTEQLLVALQSRGHELHIDRDAIFKLGDLARPLFAERGNDPLHFASGAAKLHSRNVPPLAAAAKAKGFSPRDFVFRAGMEMRRRGTNVSEPTPEAVVAAVAEGLSPPQTTLSEKAVSAVARRFGSPRTLAEECTLLFSRAAKIHKTSVLHLVPAGALPFGRAYAWESAGLVGVTIPVGDRPLETVPADRAPEVVLVDDELASRADLPVARNQRYTASVRALTAEAACELALLVGERIFVADPAQPALAPIAARLAERGRPSPAALPAGPRVVIAATSGPWREALAAEDTVILVGGQRDAELVAALRAKGVRCLRPPIADAVAARVSALLGTSARLAALRGPVAVGPSTKAVEPLVAAGPGEVVLDSTDSPAQLIDGEASAQELARARLSRTAAL